MHAREAEISRPRAKASQCGAPRAGETPAQIDAAVVRNAAREHVDVGRGADDLRAVAQPLHDRAADELTAAFQRIVGDPAALPRDGRQQVVARRHGLLPRIEQQEASGAVGILGHPWGKAGLPKKCGLLVACDAGNRDVRAVDGCI
jgi:hypothetical protein